jgi:hypothetical protein
MLLEFPLSHEDAIALTNVIKKVVDWVSQSWDHVTVSTIKLLPKGMFKRRCNITKIR